MTSKAKMNTLKYKSLLRVNHLWSFERVWTFYTKERAYEDNKKKEKKKIYKTILKEDLSEIINYLWLELDKEIV